MGAAAVSRRARRFVAASVAFLIAWQLAAVAGVPRRVEVVLGVYGFVLHAAFGKAYSLVPSYFDRTLAAPRAPAVHLPPAVVGTVALAVAPLDGVPGVVGAAGAVLWAVGVAVFVGAIGWTVRDNPTGRETGTGEPNAHRRRVDRYANAFVPVALAYLLTGSYATVAGRTALPGGVGGAGTAHLLAAGVAALLIFAVGFRLFPRFLGASPPRALVAVVPAAGALGPAVLAADFYGGARFRLGATLQAVAVVGFAAAYAALFVRSERRRAAFYGPLVGGACGVLGVVLGLGFAFGALGPRPALAAAHFRLNVLGFLGLTVAGAAYQFYPPNVGAFPWSGDRLALTSIGLVGAGLLGEVAGALAARPIAVAAGRASAVAGSALVAYLVVGVFAAR